MSRMKNIKNTIERYGIYVAVARYLHAYGFLSSEALQKILENRYYPRLTKDEMSLLVQEWYNCCGLSDDVRNPTTFTGKIQWLKLNGDLDTMGKRADKYAVKSWVSHIIGERYLIQTLGAWDCVKDVDFDSLPRQFVLKANHGCGFNYVIKNKSEVDWSEVKRLLQEWLDTSFGWNGMEIHYLRIPRKIIAEEYISQMDGNLLDYKVHCFDGEPTFIQVIGDRDLKKHTGMQANYDFKWKRMPWIFEDYPAYDYEQPRPHVLREIYSVSKSLCRGFAYVRVDLYEIDGAVKFGEMTFTPGNGCYPYKGTWTRELDEHYGAMIPIGK